MCVCVCVYMHTHPHTAREVLGCEPRGRDETHGETKGAINLRIHISVYVYKVHIHIYAGRWDEIRTICFYLQIYLFFSAKKEKKCEHTESSYI